MSQTSPIQMPVGHFKLTIDEYAELPNDGKRYQLLDGDLDVTPAPSPFHQTVSRRLQFILMQALEETGEGAVFNAPIDVVLDRTSVVQPDLVFIRREQFHIVGEKNIQGVPDLVVEILSPSSRRTDALLKSRLYASFAIPSYWIVDPDLDRLVVVPGHMPSHGNGHLDRLVDARRKLLLGGFQAQPRFVDEHLARIGIDRFGHPGSPVAARPGARPGLARCPTRRGARPARRRNRAPGARRR